MQVDKLFIVSIQRGLYVRNEPVIHPSNIITSIPRGREFRAVEITRIGDRTWARNTKGEYINIAVGQTFHVVEKALPRHAAG